jgi:selenium metabolism protein YedF
MPLTVDARGMPCPRPVILSRNAMREDDDVTTLVSQPDQVDNVRRLAERAGWTVTVTAADSDMTRGHATAEPEVTADLAVCPPGQGGRVLVLASDEIGRGARELGQILMRSLLYTLREVTPRPDTLILMNAGVKLAVDGSPVLNDLRALESDGLQILICGTCLGYYELKDRVAVGSISNMYSIAETLLAASQSTYL